MDDDNGIEAPPVSGVSLKQIHVREKGKEGSELEGLRHLCKQKVVSAKKRDTSAGPWGDGNPRGPTLNGPYYSLAAGRQIGQMRSGERKRGTRGAK